MSSKLGIYIHIPFCVRKCAYCDFLSFPADGENISSYINTLKKEMKNWSCICGKYGRNDSVRTIYFGGGTPSSIDSSCITELLDIIKSSFSVEDNAEITIECNPGTVTEKTFSDYYHAGINRISMGLQSADNTELAALGRIHTYEEFVEAFLAARSAGFENISVDVMSALPRQTIPSYKKTLEKVLALHPEHISSYSLIIEEGTKFAQLYREGKLKLPDEEEEREMYYLTNRMLEEYGYHRYEISNYAKEGRESRHNSSYWQGVNYLGLGLGASSLLDHIRFQNTADIKKYMSRWNDSERILDRKEIMKNYEEAEILTEKAQMEEYMFLGLRMMAGISISDFDKRFSKSLEEIYGNVCRKLVKQALLTWEQDTVRLTTRGIDVSNMVFAEFLINELT
jgi:oxygen-independent coproporphyrinogen-3 oxidase